MAQSYSGRDLVVEKWLYQRTDTHISDSPHNRWSLSSGCLAEKSALEGGRNRWRARTCTAWYPTLENRDELLTERSLLRISPKERDVLAKLEQLSAGSRSHSVIRSRFFMLTV